MSQEMRVRWLVLLSAGVMAFSSAAWGERSSPDPARSFIEFTSFQCDSIPRICPHGIGTSLRASLRDSNDSPVTHALVEVELTSSCAICLCCPVEGLTDANGMVEIPIYGGIDASASASCCTVTAAVSCLGVEIPWVHSGEAEDTRPWLSGDLNGDCVENTLDAEILAGDFQSSACRSDWNCDGIVNNSDAFQLIPHTSAEHDCGLPTRVQDPELGALPSLFLDGNKPNPFNPSTEIVYSIARSGPVTLRIFDLTGRAVRTLVVEDLDSGEHRSTWDGSDESGRPMPTGVYFAHLETAGETGTRKIVLLR